MSQFRIDRQCGACGYMFDDYDPLVAIVQQDGRYVAIDALTYMHNSSMGLDRILDRTSFPVENATVHRDCFNLYLQRARAPDKLHRLWVAGTARIPWCGSSPLLLPTAPSFRRASRLATDQLGLPSLASLPDELLSEIWGLTGSNDMLRFCSVLDTIDTIEGKEWKDPVSIPLRNLSTWSRGSNPTASEDDDDSAIDLVIDARGIKEIRRRSPCPEPLQQKQSPSLAFMSIPANEDVKACFQLGMARLTPQAGTKRLLIWDVPRPPDLDAGKPLGIPFGGESEPPIPEGRLATIEAERCFGLTFFMSMGAPHAIHAHTRLAPSADVTFARLSRDFQRTVLWIYVPITPEDRLLAFGVNFETDYRPGDCYMFRTDLCGDFTIGAAYDPKENHDLDIFRGVDGSTIVHTAPHDNLVRMIAACPGADDEDLAEFNPFSPTFRSRVHSALYSAVPMRDVTRMWVYRDDETWYCRGLMLEYEDGSARTLGSCRVGIDPVEECDDLARFVYRTARNPDPDDPFLYVQVAVLPPGEEMERPRSIEEAVLEAWVDHRGMSMKLTYPD